MATNRIDWTKKGLGWIPDLPDATAVDKDQEPGNITGDEISNSVTQLTTQLIALIEVLESSEKSSQSINIEFPQKSSQIKLDKIKLNKIHRELLTIKGQLTEDIDFPEVNFYKVLQKKQLGSFNEPISSQTVARLRSALVSYCTSNPNDRVTKTKLLESAHPEKPECQRLFKWLDDSKFDESLELKQLLVWLKKEEFDTDLSDIIKVLQAYNNLVVDGIVGVRTYNAIERIQQNNNSKIENPQVSFLPIPSIIPDDILDLCFEGLRTAWLVIKFDQIKEKSKQLLQGESSSQLLQDDFLIIEEYFQKNAHKILNCLNNIKALKAELEKFENYYNARHNSIEGSSECLKNSITEVISNIKEMIEINLAMRRNSLNDVSKIFFFCSCREDFRKLFRSNFHHIEPIVTAFYQVASPFAGFSNVRQAVDTSFRKLYTYLKYEFQRTTTRYEPFAELFQLYSGQEILNNSDSIKRERFIFQDLGIAALTKINREKKNILGDYFQAKLDQDSFLQRLIHFLLRKELIQDKSWQALEWPVLELRQPSKPGQERLEIFSLKDVVSPLRRVAYFLGKIELWSTLLKFNSSNNSIPTDVEKEASSTVVLTLQEIEKKDWDYILKRIEGWKVADKVYKLNQKIERVIDKRIKDLEQKINKEENKILNKRISSFQKDSLIGIPTPPEIQTEIQNTWEKIQDTWKEIQKTLERWQEEWRKIKEEQVLNDSSNLEETRELQNVLITKIKDLDGFLKKNLDSIEKLVQEGIFQISEQDKPILLYLLEIKEVWDEIVQQAILEETQEIEKTLDDSPVFLEIINSVIEEAKKISLEYVVENEKFKRVSYLACLARKAQEVVDTVLFFEFLEEIYESLNPLSKSEEASLESEEVKEYYSNLYNKEEVFSVPEFGSNSGKSTSSLEDKNQQRSEVGENYFGAVPLILPVPIQNIKRCFDPENLPNSYNKQSSQQEATEKSDAEKEYYFFLPNAVDLTLWCSPIRDQGSLNACTALAGTALVEYWSQKKFDKREDLSALFLYKTARKLIQRSGDSGSSVQATMQAMVLFGIPPEDSWPYQEENFDDEPPPFCYSYGQNYQTLKYFHVDTGLASTDGQLLLFRIRAMLAAGIPCMFGLTLYSSVYDERNISQGYIPYPSPKDQIAGGHTLVAVGYNDYKIIDRASGDPSTAGALLVRNSWGRDWGKEGYGWLPYDYVLKGLTADWWSLVKAEWFDRKTLGLGVRKPGGNPGWGSGSGR